MAEDAISLGESIGLKPAQFRADAGGEHSFLGSAQPDPDLRHKRDLVDAVGVATNYGRPWSQAEAAGCCGGEQCPGTSRVDQEPDRPKAVYEAFDARMGRVTGAHAVRQFQRAGGRIVAGGHGDFMDRGSE
jgi:hypothetical protein